MRSSTSVSASVFGLALALALSSTMPACGGSTSIESPTGEGGADAAASGDGASADASSSDGSHADVVIDPRSCSERYLAALDKQCATAADCELVSHNDCCGTVVTAIHKGSQATFQAAEQAFLACETGCSGRGCAHPDFDESGQSVLSGADGGTRTIVARCDANRCVSHLQ